MIAKAVPSFGSNLILFGKTKVFLKIEAVMSLESILAQKIEKKNAMAKKIQRSFFRFQQLKNLRKVFRSIKRIQTLYRVKNEYKKFRDTQKKIRTLQRFVKHKIFKRKLSEMFISIKEQRDSATKISSIYKMLREKRKFLRIKNSSNIIKKRYKIYQNGKSRKIRQMCQEILKKNVFEQAWKKIKFKLESAAVIVIQKHVRGILTRKKQKHLINLIKKKTREKKEAIAALKIQKVFRGFIQRKSTNKVKRAICVIQGFCKMRILSRNFQILREKTLIIQVLFI